MEFLFEDLYRKYHQDLFQFVFYMTRDRTLTEDLVQEVYIRVMRSYNSFRGESSEKTWLFSIARNVTIDYFRSQNRKKNIISQFFDWNKKGDFLPDHQPLPEEILLQNEEANQVYTYLEQCTIDQRSVLILRFIQSMSIKETASILGFSESKVKTTQHRGLKVLKTHIQAEKLKGEAYDE
ncbi:MAG TPA: RNA polymerase sigma factor SigX [Bacillota bacterium]|nr:RNA polymerase sigma factor SigX [Bacillota bacterium]